MALYTLLDGTGGERLLKRKITLWRKYNSLSSAKEGVGKVISHYMKVLRISGLSKQFICTYYYMITGR